MARHSFRTILLLVVMLTSVVSGGGADAAAWTKWTKQPEVKDGRVTGEAWVSVDCEGTFGCHAYIKIEFKEDGWFKSWDYVDGRWVTETGRNKIEADLLEGKCGHYRLVVDTYNDVLAGGDVSITSGNTSVSSSTKIKRVHVETGSEQLYVCGR